jgi:signal transduction histidine kinase
MNLTPEELAYEQLQADIGELAGLVTHEFNDVLNAMLLHVAVLEQSLPRNGRSELLEIRKQGKDIAGLIRQLQRYRQSQRPEDRAVDLNRIISDTVAAFPERLRARVVMHLDAELAAVVGNAVDITRLLTFLLRNALAAGLADAEIEVCTSRTGGSALLVVEDRGPPLPLDDLPSCFDLYASPREGTNSLELAACKRLVRRLQGDVRCANRQGGFSVSVTLKLASR